MIKWWSRSLQIYCVFLMTSFYLSVLFLSCLYLSFSHLILADIQVNGYIRISAKLNLSLPFFLLLFLSPHAALWLWVFHHLHHHHHHHHHLCHHQAASVKLGSTQLRSHSLSIYPFPSVCLCSPNKYRCGYHSHESLHLLPVSSPLFLQ